MMVVILLAVAVGAAVAIWRTQISSAPKTIDAPEIHVAERASFDHVVLEQGEIESSSNVEVKCEVKGRGGTGTPILWVIEEGSYVTTGDKLVELDSSSLEQELKTQRILVNSAEALVISSEAAVKQAEIARQEYLDGTFLTEEKAILSEIAVAQQDLRIAELSLSSAERLAAKGTLKTLQVEAEEFSVQNARNLLEAAEGRLRVLRELTKEKMLVQFDSDIETAKAKLDSDRSSLQEEKSKLAEIQEQIAACVINSPTDGQVVHANKVSRRGNSEFVVEAGALVREQQTIINLPDPAMMRVNAKINESRITLIREGMAAKIQASAVSNELLGRVTKVNKYAEPGGWFSSSVKEYATFVQIIDPPENIRSGMTAEVRIFVEQLENALQIPVVCVYESNGEHFVLVEKGDGVYDTNEIELGATNEKFVTINSGIEEGDRVVMNPRKHLQYFNLPETESKLDDRAALKDLADQPIEKAGGSDEENSRGPNTGGAPNGGRGGPGGGRGGPGGGFGGSGGAPNVHQIVTAIMSGTDSNSDGKITKEEAASNSRMSDAFDEYDANGDGEISRSEVETRLKSRMQQGGFGGPR